MSNKKALIVVDMQNDYLWNRRKKMFSYNTPELVNAVNSLISEFSERGDDVIYVGQVFPNIITNKWFIHSSARAFVRKEDREKLGSDPSALQNFAGSICSPISETDISGRGCQFAFCPSVP